ncbi:hypothetical protein CNR22_14610 [Sphingobacteriaceae bacterium]|nr:hypothetical protein CNR22_14610 [Sphingobacteriaceae bacterium]
MKTIFTLLLIALLTVANSAAAQTRATKPPVANKTIMVYSEDEDAFIYKSEDHMSGQEILIETLPVYGKASVPMIVHPEVNGTLTFKKHPSLIVPEYYTITIEDKLTGAVYDLKSEETFAFEVKKHVPERFVLQMSLTKTHLTAMK